MEKTITEIMDGNKAIGLFHGATYSDGTQRLYYESEDMKDSALLIHATNVNIEEAKYHTSWDWLMPVWYKLSKMDVPDEISNEFKEHLKHIGSGILYNKIDAVFERIRITLTWYNSSQLNQK